MTTDNETVKRLSVNRDGGSPLAEKHDDKADVALTPSLLAILLPSGLQPDLHRTCEIVLKSGWSTITWQRGFTALHLAAKHGSEDAVRLLLHASAAPALAQEDCRQLKPIDHARKKGHSKAFVELLDPRHAMELASGAAIAEAQPPQMSDANIKAVRDVHDRQCKEVDEAAYQRGRGEGRAQVEELRTALASERATKAKAGESSASADIAALREELAKERAEGQKRQDELDSAGERYRALNRTVTSAFTEREAAKKTLEELQEKLRGREQELVEVQARVAELEVAAAACVAGPGPKPAADNVGGTILFAPRTSEPRLARISVDLTETLPTLQAAWPDSGIRTQLPSVMPGAIPPPPQHETVDQMSTDFWESVLRPSDWHANALPSSPADSISSAAVGAGTSKAYSPSKRPTATGRRASFDCEVGEQLPVSTMDHVGTPVAKKMSVMEVDLTQSLT